MDESAAATMTEHAREDAQAEMNAELLKLIPTYYPQPRFAPLLTPEQVLNTLEAVETRFHALEPVAQGLLCEAVAQLLRLGVATHPNYLALFRLGELTETLGLDTTTARSQVMAALEALAAVQVVLVDNALPDEGPHGSALLRSFSLVWRSTLLYSEAAKDTVVVLVLGEEITPLIWFAALIEEDRLLLPDWLRCDG